MKTSEAIDQLFTALAAAQGEMPDAVFNRENPHFKSQYADFSAIREATRVLSKHGIAVTQGPQLTEEGWMYQSTLVHGKSGQWCEHQLPITLGTPQALGSLMTYMKRYLLSGQCAVAADADDDGEVAEASAKRGRGASEQTLGEKLLSKEKSRPVYDALIKEMRGITNKGKLQTWGLTNSDRIHSMHKDNQKWFLDEYKQHRTAIEVGADEDGQTVGEQIDDEVPTEGGGDAA
jgi:hypothetical protein